MKTLHSTFLLEMSFFDRYKQGIFLSERKLVSGHSQPVDIITESSKARNAVLFADYQYCAVPGGETSHNRLAANLVKLALYSHRPEMVANSCLRILIIDPTSLHASRASLQIAKGIIEVAPSQPFYGLLTNLSE